jgi:Protein of unknown function (DUF3379)
MDCESYREAITADPSERFEGGSAHAASCPECRAFRAEMRVLDDRIARALAIETPEPVLPELPPLGARNAPGNVTAMARRRRFAAPGWIGLAAAIGVAAIVAWSSLVTDENYPPIAGQVLAHMDYEESSRRVTTLAVSEAALGQVLAQRVSDFDAGPRIVSYASACVINGNVTPHLVVQGRTGPITLILMPEERIDTAIPIEGEHVHGVILPVGSGSVAVIGQRQEQQPEIEAVGERVIESVQWTI